MITKEQKGDLIAGLTRAMIEERKKRNNKLAMKIKPKTIYDLKLHEGTQVTKYIYAMRVPGGWIYEVQRQGNSASPIANVFVEFDAKMSDIVRHIDSLEP